MKDEIAYAEFVSTQVEHLVKKSEPEIRKLDKGLADKVKKMGEAATEVKKHIQERADRTAPKAEADKPDHWY